MRIVLDTNVVVSALLWRGTPHTLLRAAVEGTLTLCTSKELLAELREVLGREHLLARLDLQSSSVDQALALYGALAVSVTPTLVPGVVLADPDDDHVIAAAVTAKADLEFFAIGPFDLPDEAYFTGPAAYPNLAPNLWPDRPATLRPAMQAYWRALERLARALCASYATALGLPDDYFAASIGRHASQLRLMHYPAPSEPPPQGQMRAGEHTDLGMMTLLYSDNAVGGLQVKRRDGRWVDAPVTPGTFVVNLGDMMMRWTNDRWISTPHRVVNPPPGAEALSRRLSVGMFFIPNYDAEIACIETCRVAGEPPRYAPISVAAYRTARFARTAGTATAA